MASSCAGVRRDSMPSGSSRTGQKMPNTPGSICEGEDKAGMGKPSGSGMAFLRIRRICIQHLSQKAMPTTMPQSHTARRIDASGNDACGETTWVGAVDAAKGWIALSTTNDHCGWAMGAPLRQLNRLPSATRKENGRRNLTDAANHSQYRTAARFFLNASVRRQITPTKIVDCQRLFANGVKDESSALILTALSSISFATCFRLLLCRPGSVRPIPRDEP